MHFGFVYVRTLGQNHEKNVITVIHNLNTGNRYPYKYKMQPYFWNEGSTFSIVDNQNGPLFSNVTKI